MFWLIALGLVEYQKLAGVHNLLRLKPLRRVTISGLSNRQVVAEVGLIGQLLNDIVPVVQSLDVRAWVHLRHCHRATTLWLLLSLLQRG